MGTGGRRANCATSKKEEVGLDRPHYGSQRVTPHGMLFYGIPRGRGNEGALETAGGEIWSVR